MNLEFEEYGWPEYQEVKATLNDSSVSFMNYTTPLNAKTNHDFIFAGDGTTKDLLIGELQTLGGYQYSLKFNSYRSKDTITPIVYFLIVDSNGNIIQSVVPKQIYVNDDVPRERVVVLDIPSTVTAAHQLLIRCSISDPYIRATCSLNDFLLDKLQNGISNIKMSSWTTYLNVTWDSSLVGATYRVQILDKTGNTILVDVESVGNTAQLPIDGSEITTNDYRVRIQSTTLDNIVYYTQPKIFVFIKAGESYTPTNLNTIDYLLICTEDVGFKIALNTPGLFVDLNKSIDVKRAGLRMMIKSGSYYFFGLPFVPDECYVSNLLPIHRSNLLLRYFNYDAYKVPPYNFSLSYPIMGDGTSTMPYSQFEIGKGYVLSVNSSVTGGAGPVYLTFIGTPSLSAQKVISFTPRSTELTCNTGTGSDIGTGNNFQGWTLLTNPYPNNFVLTNNFYASVSNIVSKSTTDGVSDDKVATSGYSVFRNYPGDIVPAFVPIFVHQNGGILTMVPGKVTSSVPLS